MDCTSIRNKILCGYQGWFLAEGDGMQCSWRHWFHAKTEFEPVFDVWPDTREFGPGELFPSPLLMPDGTQALLFSSCHAGLENIFTINM
jgi:glycoprotein endo-alpha-1,2-mannosidase